MTKIKGKTLLITGGASGIGRIMGRRALQMGARSVVIWDINQQNLVTAEEELSAYGKVKGYRVDVADEQQVEKMFALTVEQCGDVDILINSAGIITSNRTFDQQTQQEISRTMAINAIAPMTVALQALPPMISRDVGHICNIASAAGLISNPRMSVYVASKWAVVGWSDSVRVELKQQRSNVHITTIAPYYINTGMFDGVRSRVIPILKPEWVARRILRAIERNKKICGLPLGYHLIRVLEGVLPLSWFEALCGILGIYNTMDHFTGRKKE